MLDPELSMNTETHMMIQTQSGGGAVTSQDPGQGQMGRRELAGKGQD